MTAYLDNAATTKPKKEVIDAMMPYLTEKWFNPSSLYASALDIKNDIENARCTIAEFIEADKNEIFFTSGGSESNCWAIQGFVNECRSKCKTPVIITSLIEHKSILECVKNLNDTNIHFIGVDKNGFVNIKVLEELLKIESFKRDHEVLVSIQYANNEIGTRQPVSEIAELTHKYNAIFHTDAVQAFGHLPIDVRESDIDMLSASGHKIGTPKGIGFLYKKENIKIKPLIYGSQMDGMRGGTENVPYIIGMAKAVELLNTDELDSFGRFMRVSCKKNYLVNMLIKRFGCKLNGYPLHRLPNNANITFPQNITGEALLYMLDMSGFQISTSSACDSHSIEPSHVLKAIGLSDEEAMRTIRISLSDDITDREINKFIDELDKAIKIIESESE